MKGNLKKWGIDINTGETQALIVPSGSVICNKAYVISSKLFSYGSGYMRETEGKSYDPTSPGSILFFSWNYLPYL